MKNVVITSAVRTPIGKLGGMLKDVKPEKLGSIVIKEVIERCGIKTDTIDEIVIGNSKQTADAPNLARVAALKAEIPESVPAYTIHRQCGSGMQSIINAVWQIQTGYAEIVVAGGVESMSTAPFYIRKGRFGYLSGNGYLLDPNTESQPKSQPESKFGSFNMGITAENLASMYKIKRKEQDEFAYCSQIKALKAIKTGRFKDEIIPVEIKTKKGIFVFDEDEHPRRDINFEKLGKLKPVFKENGTVTAGNSSGRNDGAAALLLMSEEKAKELGLRPLARFVSAGIKGVDPRVMGLGPVPATKQALEKAGLTLSDINIIELNEAFSAQSLAVIRELKLNKNIVNLNGGAISLGHPIGCSGTRIVVTLLHEMLKRQEKYGLATLCVAGGQGVSTIFENVNI